MSPGVSERVGLLLTSCGEGASQRREVLSKQATLLQSLLPLLPCRPQPGRNAVGRGGSTDVGARCFFSFWGCFWDFLPLRGARKVSEGQAAGDRLPQPSTPGDLDPGGSSVLLPRRLLL